MPIRIHGGVFSDQIVTGSLRHFVIDGANFGGAIDSFGQPVASSAAEIIFSHISEDSTIDIMNPTAFNISFALESGRSNWDAPELTIMVQSLGTDVGVDHINCTLCTVTEVPYIWNLGAGGSTFLTLFDTPDTYVGSARFSVTVNPTETGLVFTPDISDYKAVPPGSLLEIGMRYYITASGTVTLPSSAGSAFNAGQSITITTPVGADVFVNVGAVTDNILTDLGSTDSLEIDVTEEVVLVFNGSWTWNLQIGAVL